MNLTSSKIGLLVQKLKNLGVTILAGCCEIRPKHIKEIAKLK